MKLALLKETPLNPWHLPAYHTLTGAPEVAAFHKAAPNAPAPLGNSLAQWGIHRVWELPAPRDGSWLRRLGQRVALQGRRPTVDVDSLQARLQEFDLLHSWELYSEVTEAALEAKRRWNLPVWVEVWDNVPLALERNPARRRRKERAVSEADRFLVHTEAARHMLEVAGASEDRIVRLAPGLDTTQYAPGARARQRYGLKLNDFVILLGGGLTPRKGMEFLLLSLRELIRDKSLRKKRPVRLWVVGPGAAKDRMQTLARQLGVAERCTFTPAPPDAAMPFVYRSADLFVLPDSVTPEWQEQSGMNVLEAMACGVPVVSTHSGVLAELIEDAGVLCPPDDVVALHQALKRFVQEAAHGKKYAARSRQRAMYRYDLARYTTAIGALLRDYDPHIDTKKRI